MFSRAGLKRTEVDVRDRVEEGTASGVTTALLVFWVEEAYEMMGERDEDGTTDDARGESAAIDVRAADAVAGVCHTVWVTVASTVMVVVEVIGRPRSCRRAP
jgi:hypothetical protein